MLGTLAMAWLAARTCQALGTPLPWMIGPLLATAAASTAGWEVRVAPGLRPAGQAIIGCALGLYFTPDVVRLVGALAPALVAGIVWALLMALAFSRLLARYTGDHGESAQATAYFSAAIGGASEMAVLAERHGARVDRVAAAHSLRLLIVVIVIPFAFQASDLPALDSLPAAARGVDALGLAGLAALTAAGVLILAALRMPNPFMLGALMVSLVLTASDQHLSALPQALTDLGQLFIGVALGSRFSPEFARAAPRWLGAVALGTLLMMGASAGFAAVLAMLVGLHPATVMLGTSPGGIAEMCITAKVLQLGVPVVTAFHVTRYLAVLLLTAPLYQWARQRRAAAS